jgi:hypothetical protein
MLPRSIGVLLKIDNDACLLCDVISVFINGS